MVQKYFPFISVYIQVRFHTELSDSEYKGLFGFKNTFLKNKPTGEKEGCYFLSI